MKELQSEQLGSVTGGSFSPGELAGAMGAGCVTAVMGASIATGGTSNVAFGQVCAAGAVIGGFGYLFGKFIEQY
ncbi:hypothetical protein [Ferrimonas futtsuensis]|uniref:hypothetical protein n=1 Tax=Ferrimonas futtsuensis TaxID=364764 RepID=UPI0012FA495C|nr:hypothetical protein [Ferrimonas futtsuensis]